MKKLLSTLLLCFYLLPAHLQNQHKLDSLESLLPNLKGKEKVMMLGELCFQYSYVDIAKAIQFGRQGVSEAETTKDSMLIAQAWNDLSIPFFYKGEYDSSLYYNLKALKIREQEGDSLSVAKSLSKMANSYYEKGDLKSSLAYNLRGVAIFKAADKIIYTGQMLSNIGNIYDRNANYDKAIEYFNQAIQVAESTNNTSTYITSTANLANTYQKIDRLKEAEKLFLELIPLIKEQGNLEYLSSVYQGLGVNYRRRHLIDKGIEYYKKALEIYEKTGSESGISVVQVNLGYCYLEKGEYTKAESLLLNGLELAKKTNSHYTLQHAYLGLAHLETRKQNFEKSDNYFDLYVAHSDSIYNEESNRLIQEMQVKYETEKKEKELAENRAELLKEQVKLKQRNTQLALAGGGVLSLLLLGLIFMRQQKQKRERLKQEAKLKVQNERIRISRDLHDNIGAELTIISSSLDKKAYQSNNESEKKELENISDNARNAMTQLRETIWAIGNDKVELGLFAAKVQEYGTKICQPNNINFELTVEENSQKKLSPSQTINLYRICQEAINNAVKYAEANTIKVNIDLKGINITDDGKGFDTLNARKGYGLQNMKQRAQEINSIMEITSNKNGTTIAIKSV